MSWIVGVDVGGTFTDFYGYRTTTGEPFVHKIPSTPDDPARAIIEGIDDLCRSAGIPMSQVKRVEHGTTVATNSLLERRGASVALITTKGFRDLAEIGRQTRPHMYDLQKDAPAPLVPREWRFEVAERVTASGAVLRPLDDEDIRTVVERVKASGVEACAVCFLFSFVDPTHERRVGAALSRAMPDLFVSLSSDVQPEFREFERLSTTVLNGYLQPVVSRYLDHLERAVRRAAPETSIDINQSRGGLMSLDTARRYPIRTALSGPAAGVVGAIQVARAAECPDMITLDVGGTSADVCLVQGYESATAFSRTVCEFPVRLPMVDIETIGAGGGSVAWFDRDGLMKVGPISAGAVPGPACYGAGGERPTVTDANLILGRLSLAGLIGGRMPLDLDAARAVVEPLARRLGMAVERAAHGIVSIAVSNMVRALRAVSIERGHDPRAFTLMPFGGAGPLHATDVARSLGSTDILVPPAPGILCANGLVASDLTEDFVLTARTRVDDSNVATVARNVDELRSRAAEWFDKNGIDEEDRAVEATLDMRCVGQNFELAVALEGASRAEVVTQVSASRLREMFFDTHEKTYGFSNPDEAVEVINFRLAARGSLHGPTRSAAPLTDDPPPPPIAQRAVFFEPDAAIDSPVFARDDFGRGHTITGPAVIEQFDATTLVYPGDVLRIDHHNNMRIEVRR